MSVINMIKDGVLAEVDMAFPQCYEYLVSTGWETVAPSVPGMVPAPVAPELLETAPYVPPAEFAPPPLD